ncbi:MAG: NAD-binding protein [Actinobacteria bacterium]|nr:NAD-binding protein [Actinomycetota bacterium]
MPIFVARLIRLVRTRVRGWRLSLAIATFVFLTSWLAMWLVEPASNQITSPQNYWWWFLVTSATVGYGDFFPMSGAGHLVGAYVIVGGIVALTILFTELASAIQNVKGKRMKGVVELDVSDHTVILGYTPGRTQRIVAEFGVEGRLELVLCAWDEVAEHPMPEQAGVRFVRGDLTAADVLARACVERAATVVIDGRDDNETLAIAVAVDHLNPRVHLVAALRDMSRCQHLRYVNPHVQCVQWHMPNLLTEEALDPGITQVYAELMSSAGSGNTYSARLPKGLSGQTFGECQMQFGRRFGATVIAVRQGDGLAVSPAWDTLIQAGAVLYYVADHRIDESRLSQTR